MPSLSERKTVAFSGLLLFIIEENDWKVADVVGHDEPVPLKSSRPLIIPDPKDICIRLLSD